MIIVPLCFFALLPCCPVLSISGNPGVRRFGSRCLEHERSVSGPLANCFVCVCVCSFVRVCVCVCVMFVYSFCFLLHSTAASAVAAYATEIALEAPQTQKPSDPRDDGREAVFCMLGLLLFSSPPPPPSSARTLYPAQPNGRTRTTVPDRKIPIPTRHIPS